MPPGLILRRDANTVKVWSAGANRVVTYGLDILPKGCSPGDWVDIKLESGGILKGIFEREEPLLNVRHSNEGALEVLDYWLLDERYGKAFSTVIGFATTDSSFDFPPSKETEDTCYQLWATIEDDLSFSIHTQSWRNTVSEGDKDAHILRELRNEISRARLPQLVDDVRRSGDDALVDDLSTFKPGHYEVLVTGRYNDMFFVSSRVGDALLMKNTHNYHPVYEPGKIFEADLTLSDMADTKGKARYVVSSIDSSPVQPSSLVSTQVSKSEEVTLTCPVTLLSKCTSYPGFLVYSDLVGVAHLPQNLYGMIEMKNEGKALVTMKRVKERKDRPSNWVVSSMIRVICDKEWNSSVLPKKSIEPINEGAQCSQSRSTLSFSSDFDNTDMITVMVTGFYNDLYFVSTRSNVDAVILPSVRKDAHLEIGEFIKAVIKSRECRDREEGTSFSVVYMERMEVQPSGVSIQVKKGVPVVACLVKVEEKCDKRFIVQSDVVGTAVLPFSRAPRGCRVGDTLKVDLHRAREALKDSPSKWLVSLNSASIVKEDPCGSSNTCFNDALSTSECSSIRTTKEQDTGIKFSAPSMNRKEEKKEEGDLIRLMRRIMKENDISDAIKNANSSIHIKLKDILDL